MKKLYPFQGYYPYRLSQDQPFHLETLPIFGLEERIEFLYNYKRQAENLYIGNIDKKHLLLKSSSSLFQATQLYFTKKYYEDRDNVLGDFNKRSFPKICWLTDSFFKAGFDFPVSVHYNPRIQQNVIHPGSTRNHVIQMFQHSPTVQCLYFNTGGVEFKFMDSLKVFTKEDLLSYIDSLEMELVADHASIIPHINIDSKTVSPNILKWQEFVYRRLTSPTFSIYCNTSVDLFKPWQTTQDSANIEITIERTNQEQLEENICKSLILAVLGKSYKSDSLTVTHKLEFNTPE